MEPKITIGILGGIGSGKSVVSRCLGQLGCAVIDADALAHGVLADPSVTTRLVERFGDAVLGSDGAIDRRLLGRRVFDDPAATAFLNDVVHPEVLGRCERLMTRCADDPAVAAIVLDMPLLLEVGWEKRCDFLIFVDCPIEKRLERVSKNGKIDVDQLKKREKFQISLDKKKQIAHYIVYNNSDISDVTEQIAQLFSSIAKSK